jgi:hypothetical protein
VTVPSECVVRRDGSSVVFVLDSHAVFREESARSDGGAQAEQAPSAENAPVEESTPPFEYLTVTQRAVKAGISVDGVTEIIEGLEPGETVVSRGQTLLENGSHVQVVDTEAAPGTGKGGAA